MTPRRHCVLQSFVVVRSDCAISVYPLLSFELAFLTDRIFRKRLPGYHLDSDCLLFGLCSGLTMSKRGITLNSQAREQVVKLYTYFERESANGGPLLPVTQTRDRVADALGIGKKTVTQILNEKYGPSGSEENRLGTPKKRKREKKVVGIDNFDAAAIRNHIYGYYSRKEYPTRKKLIISLNEAGLFSGGKTSLSKVLKSIGFRYKKADKRKILLERYDIVLKRLTFLRQVNKITDWDNVVFVDETWLNANHTVSRTWTDDTAASTSKVPSGKGARLIICHAGSASQGLIPDCLLAFASKSTGDYHEEMNFDVFKEWFVKLLLSLENPSKIIMDNAPYHSVQVDKPPTQANKKNEIASWLERHGVEVNPNLLKIELMNLVRTTMSSKPRYVIDELALEHGHEVIRLPPYHCQYNAIELIWAQIKGHAARNNTEPPFSTGKMLTLLKNACDSVSVEDWKKVVEKTKKIIESDFERDITIDNIIENELIISVSADSSDDDDTDNSCSSTE